MDVPLAREVLHASRNVNGHLHLDLEAKVLLRVLEVLVEGAVGHKLEDDHGGLANRHDAVAGNDVGVVKLRDEEGLGKERVLVVLERAGPQRLQRALDYAAVLELQLAQLHNAKGALAEVVEHSDVLPPQAHKLSLAAASQLLKRILRHLGILERLHAPVRLL